MVLVALVEAGELLAELVLGDVGARWVEDVTVEVEKFLLVFRSLLRFEEISSVAGECTHTTICLRPSSGLRMNLRVRRVTWPSDIIAVLMGDVGGWVSFESERSPGLTSSRDEVVWGC